LGLFFIPHGGIFGNIFYEHKMLWLTDYANTIYLPFSGNQTAFFYLSEMTKIRADTEKPTIQVG